MAAARRRLKNDPVARVTLTCERKVGEFPEEDLRALEREDLAYCIAELRESETQARQLRKRLEALRDEVERACPVCGGPVAGRADRVYDKARCRVSAHRSAAGNKSGTD